MSDSCFHMGCVDWVGSDTCGECGRWTGAKSQYEKNCQESIASWVDKATDALHSEKENQSNGQ